MKTLTLSSSKRPFNHHNEKHLGRWFAIFLIFGILCYVGILKQNEEHRKQFAIQTTCPVTQCRSKLLYSKFLAGETKEWVWGDHEILVNFSIGIQKFFRYENCTKSVDCWYYDNNMPAHFLHPIKYGIGRSEQYSKTITEVAEEIITSIFAALIIVSVLKFASIVKF